VKLFEEIIRKVHPLTLIPIVLQRMKLQILLVLALAGLGEFSDMSLITN
jgi:hypothetical protein